MVPIQMGVIIFLNFMQVMAMMVTLIAIFLVKRGFRFLLIARFLIYPLVRSEI